MLLRELFDNTQTVGIIFGRFNPPHKGHISAWKQLEENTHWYIGTNQLTHGIRDPLLFEDKVTVMTALCPSITNHILAETSWLTMASKVFEQHGSIHLKCYTDEEWVTKTIIEYNNKQNKHGFYNFKTITHVPTARESSATALREAVIDNDQELFSNASGIDASFKIGHNTYFDLIAESLLPHLHETVKKVKGKWALVSKSNPSKVLQYYHGSGYPSKDWIKQVEQRVHSFEDAAGVGIVTSQNTTKDVGKGTLRKNLKAFKLIDETIQDN